jgi:polar amino acid transport system substrate-binding protein
MASDSSRNLNRRHYLRAVGASGSIALLTGCLDDGGGGGTDGNDTDGNDTDGEGGREIVAGTAPGFPPFEMKEGNELIGFDIDLLEAVVAETEFQLTEWNDFEFDSLIPALTNDRIDVIAAAMTITEGRSQTIAFTDPYYSADQSVLVREEGDFQPGSLDDLADRVVGAQEGTTGEQVVQDELIEPGKLAETNYRGFGSYVLAIQDLENGNIDAVVLDKPVAETFAAQRAVEVAFVYETGEQYGFGVRQNDDALVSALNDGLVTVQESGQYEEITSEWFGQDGSGGS